MSYPNSSITVWFGSGRQNDAQYLQTWRGAPVTYSPEAAVGADWAADRYEIILGRDATGDLFRRAADLTLHNRFYPSQVMTTKSDYELENRPVRTGDRVLQRIRLLQYEGWPLVEALTLNEITDVIDEPREAGFTYTTTAAHSEVGEWSPRVLWRENGEVALIIEVVSRIRPGAPALAQRFSRQLQLRAHRLSIQNFMGQLKGEPGPQAEPFAPALPRLAPIALALVAYSLYAISRLAFHKK